MDLDRELFHAGDYANSRVVVKVRSGIGSCFGIAGIGFTVAGGMRFAGGSPAASSALTFG